MENLSKIDLLNKELKENGFSVKRKYLDNNSYGKLSSYSIDTIEFLNKVDEMSISETTVKKLKDKYPNTFDLENLRGNIVVYFDNNLRRNKIRKLLKKY